MNPRLRRIAGRVARRIGLRPPLPGRRPTNGRLAFVGPMPSAATGIASYDRAVLDGLGRIGFLERHRTDVLWPVKAHHPRSIRGYDLGIYQLGNNAGFHRLIYRLAFASPGLVVLHDLALDGLVRKLEMAGDPHAFAATREAAALRRDGSRRRAARASAGRVVRCRRAGRSRDRGPLGVL